MAGLEAELHQQGTEYAVSVDAREADTALRELQEYAAEAETTTTAAPPPIVSRGWLGATIWVVMLASFYVLSKYQPFTLPWLSAGVAQTGLIREGEWWRVVTALCLHADIRHLAGNSALGAFLGLVAAQRLGWGLAWLGILLAGALGNAINAMVQSAAHSSIGASTAVFGALGILAAHGWKGDIEPARRAIERWAPLVCGVLLLGMFGMAGERTDIVAHVTGFSSGLLAGWIFASLKPGTLLNRRYQAIAGASALAMLSFSWLLAFTYGAGPR